MTTTTWKRAVAVGAAVGLLNLGHYALTAKVPGLELPFGIFPGGFPVAAVSAAAGRLTPQLKVMLVFGLGVVIGAAASAYRTGGFVWQGRVPAGTRPCQTNPPVRYALAAAPITTPSPNTSITFSWGVSLPAAADTAATGNPPGKMPNGSSRPGTFAVSA